MNISIVIPNYNGEKLITDNLPKIIQAVSSYKLGKVDLIIADDASKDNSVQVLQNFKKKFSSKINISIVENKKNKGFSGNVNSGIKVATGDLLVLLNTDVIPHDRFLEAIVPHFKDDRVFAVGCEDESIEGEKTVLRGRGKGRWEKGFLIHSAAKIEFGDSLWASGGSSVFSKVIWNKLGGMNELYNPFYWEDIDLSYRAQKFGFKVIFEPKSVVIHKHSAGAIRSSVTASKIQRIAYRNQILFVWLNITDPDKILSHIVWLPIHIIKALISGDMAFVTGFLNAFTRLPQVLFYRVKNLKNFSKTDREILDKFKNI